MDKIVQAGVKIDLHIHSQISSNKDGKKVKNNTEKNIPILIDKLNQNEVNICAITDHDTFSYNLYIKLKEAEEQNNSIQKVLPGIEFSVCFEVGESSEIVHIVTIFSDKDDNKVKKIESILDEMETDKDGIYIIDQPEDNISQSAIRTYLLERFKTMRENRQVIMVTHNPQFIVNLDIDNLIYISKQNDVFQVQSGSLEYVCDEYNVLDIVAQNIDGGLDSIRKRWKRYDKSVDL